MATQNPQTVALHLRHFPLAFHKQAEPAARAIQAAQKVGRGWALYDVLAKNPRNLSDPEIHTYATRIGLDMKKFKPAFVHVDIARQVNDELAAGRTAAVRGTPTIHVNGDKYGGARTVEAFQAVVDREVARADALLTAGLPKEKLYEELCK